MAGHSKFKNIQFRKGKQDKLRSKLFSKLSRDITLAAKQGIPDPNANARLRLAVANARAESMPKDNIDRAIKKGAAGENDNMEDIRYEGFGPGGVGLIVEVVTDNRNRAAANVRTIFGKNGGNLDHVVPRDRGGRDSFENLVWSKKEINSLKANRLPHEAGLRLMRKPTAPEPVPVTATIQEPPRLHWRHFLAL